MPQARAHLAMAKASVFKAGSASKEVDGFRVSDPEWIRRAAGSAAEAARLFPSDHPEHVHSLYLELVW